MKSSGRIRGDNILRMVRLDIMAAALCVAAMPLATAVAWFRTTFENVRWCLFCVTVHIARTRTYT